MDFSLARHRVDRFLSFIQQWQPFVLAPWSFLSMGQMLTNPPAAQAVQWTAALKERENFHRLCGVLHMETKTCQTSCALLYWIFVWHSLCPKPSRLVGTSFRLHSAAVQDTTKLVAGGPIHPHPSPSNFLSCNLCSTIWFTTSPSLNNGETRFSYPLRRRWGGGIYEVSASFLALQWKWV